MQRHAVGFDGQGRDDDSGRGLVAGMNRRDPERGLRARWRRGARTSRAGPARPRLQKEAARSPHSSRSLLLFGQGAELRQGRFWSARGAARPDGARRPGPHRHGRRCRDHYRRLPYAPLDRTGQPCFASRSRDTRAAGCGGVRALPCLDDVAGPRTRSVSPFPPPIESIHPPVLAICPPIHAPFVSVHPPLMSALHPEGLHSDDGPVREPRGLESGTRRGDDGSARSISGVLDVAEPSAFTQAFRRCSGATPMA